jgi:hypothetical protein
MHDCIESVDGISGVLDCTTGAVGLHQAIAALDDVTTAALLLSLGVSGQSVLDVVSVAVLGVGVVVGVDGDGGGYLSDSGGGVSEGSSDPSDGGSCISDRGGAVTQRCAWGHDGWGADDSGSCDGQQGGENEDLLEQDTIREFRPVRL